MSRERRRPQQSDESRPDETFDDEQILQGYLSRLMTLQDEREAWLEEADLDEAARDLGLSAEDLARLDATVAGHRQRGEQFLQRRLWDEAVDEFRKATALRPFDAELHHALARAYAGRWHASGADADRAAAERLARRTLELDADHRASYEILAELKRQRTASGGPSASSVRLSMALLMGILVAIGLVIAFALFVLL